MALLDLFRKTRSDAFKAASAASRVVSAFDLNPYAPAFDAKATWGNCYTHGLNMDASPLNPGELKPGYASRDPLDALRENMYDISNTKYHQGLLPMYEAYYKNGALHDELTEVKGDPARIVIPQGQYLVAMAVRCCVDEEHSKSWRSLDYHWYRQNNDGTWSHKMGPANAPRILDDSDRVITDPRTADRGPYRRITGFFLVPGNMGAKHA